VEKQGKLDPVLQLHCDNCEIYLHIISMLMAAQGHMPHSPSFQSFETGQQHPRTLVPAVASAACGLLSGNTTSGI